MRKIIVFTDVIDKEKIDKDTLLLKDMSGKKITKINIFTGEYCK